MQHLALFCRGTLFALCFSISAQAASVPLVNHDDLWNYHKGTNAPQADWKTTSDAALNADWAVGQGGFGYARNGGVTDETNNCGTIIADAFGQYSTIYLRKQFTLPENPAPDQRLFLRMDWDDGFIAWLNGNHLTNKNVSGAPAEPGHLASASADHESSLGNSSPQPAQIFDLGPAANWLTAGQHTLAIIGLNGGNTSSDFITVADLFLDVISDSEPPQLSCPAELAHSVPPGQPGTNVAFTVTVTDNYPGSSFICTPASGSFFPLGSNSVSCQATDAVGNTSACSFSVTITEQAVSPGLTSIGPRHQLKLRTPASYLPGIPFLVRLEVYQPDGNRAWDVWNAEATLSTPAPGIFFSTNRIHLYNGLGSILVLVTNSGDFDLVAAAGPIQTNRTLVCKTNVPITPVSGTLSGNNTWSGIMQVTADTILTGTLTIEPDTWVLLNGVTSGTAGVDIELQGTLFALGTDDEPIVFTCSTNGYNWGEIRHTGYARGNYYNVILNKGGRSPGGGHTGTGPMIRMGGSSTNLFADCSLTDITYGNQTMGKTMQSGGSCDLIFTNCLLQRSVMGPEISGTGLRCYDTYFLDFIGSSITGINDNDAIYVHSQGGRAGLFRNCVVAHTQDDGIDTLGSTLEIENCIIRNCDYMPEDSKGISIYGGEVRIKNSLVVNNKCGISGKDYTLVNYTLDHCTVVALVDYAIGVDNKYGDMNPAVNVRITNSILRTLNPLTNSLFTSFNKSDVHVYYSDIGESWPGANNCITANPLFFDLANDQYHLQPWSPCIDSGDPASPLDADGSRTDMGYPFPFTFKETIIAQPTLQIATRDVDGIHGMVSGDVGLKFTIEYSPNLLPPWTELVTLTNLTGSVNFVDPAITNTTQRFYRAVARP